MKRLFTVLAVLILSVSFVFAGGSKEAAPAAAEAPALEGSTQGKNTFVEGGTELSLWTFQELHVAFWTQMADEWNAQYPDRAINLTVSSAESGALHNRLLIACQAGVGTPDIADIEIGRYGEVTP